MAKYEVKTMKKDIEKLRKKASISEPIATVKKGAPTPFPAKQGEPSEKLPVPPAPAPSIQPGKPGKPVKPGAPLPSEPIATARRPEPIKLIKPEEPETEEYPRKRNIFPIVILVIILLLVGGGIYYWQNYLRAPEKVEPEVPTSLIKVERTETITIKEGEEAGLFEELKKKAQGFQEQNTFRRILVKKITEEKDYFLDFGKFSQILALNIPADISKNLAGEHTLFFYAQPASPTGGEQEKRPGIIIEIKDIVALADYLKFWEETMTTDLAPFFLGEEIGEPAIEEFQDSAYKGVNIRYLNFIDSSLAIDYAVVGKYLIITTSWESMHKAIDRVLTVRS